jgi:carboxypeptidase PM20D1
MKLIFLLICNCYLILFSKNLIGQDGYSCDHFYLGSGNIKFFAENYFNRSMKTEASLMLSEFIQYQSFSGQEEEAAAFLIRIAIEKKLHFQYLRSNNNDPNLAISIFPLDSGKPNYIFLHHIDVVSVAATDQWLKDPFGGIIENGVIWGRGAYDNKGPLIATLMAMAQLGQQANFENWPVNITLLALTGEENFSDGGAAYVAENYLSLLNPLAFIGEGPAGIKGLTKRNPDIPIFSIALNTKRALWLKLSLEYESNGHGSVPPNHYPSKDLIHGIDHLFKYKSKLYFNEYNTTLLSAIGDHEKGWRGMLLKNMHLLKPFTRRLIKQEPLYNAFFTNTISLTHLSTSGLDQNSIPSKAFAILDCRLLPETSTVEFLDNLKKRLKNDNIKIEILKETPRAASSNERSYFYEILYQSIREKYPESSIVPIMLPATNDSNFFRIKGYPVYCFVPFILTPDLLKCVHASNERLPVVVLEEGISLNKNIILNLLKYYKQ